jgi:hypothetical protein
MPKVALGASILNNQKTEAVHATDISRSQDPEMTGDGLRFDAAPESQRRYR